MDAQFDLTNKRDGTFVGSVAFAPEFREITRMEQERHLDRALAELRRRMLAELE